MSLLNQYKNCIGGKNGYTPKAGKSLVSYASNGDMTLMIVSLKDPDIYGNHKKIYEKYFSTYQNYTIIDAQNFYLESTFTKGELYLKKSFHYPLLKNEVNDINTWIEFYPTSKNGRAGRIIIKLKDKEIGKLDIFTKEKIKKEELSFFQKLKRLLIR